MSPVTPDVLKPKNILAGAAGASANTGTRTRLIPPKPLTKTSSGSVATMVASLNGNDKKTNDDTRTSNPQSTVTSADAEQSAGSGPGMTDVSTSPKSKKPAPMVPKKPATLKGAGAEQ